MNWSDSAEFVNLLHKSQADKGRVARLDRSKLFDEKDKAVILFAERVTRGSAAMRDASLLELRKFFDEAQIVDLTLVACVANFTNRFNDALHADPDLGVSAARSA